MFGVINNYRRTLGDNPADNTVIKLLPEFLVLLDAVATSDENTQLAMITMLILHSQRYFRIRQVHSCCIVWQNCFESVQHGSQDIFFINRARQQHRGLSE
ncbi:hypothetical protein BMS3Bbin04_01490 [bacterium BMS3Bbin04]|nr:hypothetical protein BMS3Bbin04_01490 [bacterium BMS3Bbin04]